MFTERPFLRHRGDLVGVPRLGALGPEQRQRREIWLNSFSSGGQLDTGEGSARPLVWGVGNSSGEEGLRLGLEG